MQFIDQAIIKVIGGRGGDGISCFRREKYVPAGGPSGGDGGAGGNVIFEADSNLQTLLDFRYERIFAANNGQRGGPNKCKGSTGREIVIKVPCGTEVRECKSGILFGDLIKSGEQIVVAFGGKGGLGNAHYLSNRNRAPEKFTEGRGYSLAMRIKEKKFCNFLHAIGKINQELSYFLKRSGFDFAHFPFKKFSHKQQGKPLNYNEIIQPFSHHYQSTK